jgi:hypothetical protein
VRHIASQRPEIQWLYSQRLGGSLVFFRHDEVMSYAIARLKADRGVRSRRFLNQASGASFDCQAIPSLGTRKSESVPTPRERSGDWLKLNAKQFGRLRA